MEDPSIGRVPDTNGAPGTNHGDEAKPASRGKRRRNRKPRPQSQESSASPQSGEQHERPENVPAQGKSRKRKRRRHGSSGGAENVVSATGDTEAQKQGQNSGKRRRNRNNRRGLQGRPLSRGNERPVDSPAEKHTPRPAQADKTAVAPNHVRHRPQHDNLYAALDLGTNNCRLLVAQPTRPGQFRVVDAFSRIVRLGEGLAGSGRLSVEAMDRSVEALKVCASKLNSRNIRKRRLIATEACRSAENGEIFLKRVVEETGLELEIINRETEARLAVSGCSSLVGREARSVVLFDIGGGSSEIAVIKKDRDRPGRLANHITHWTSLPVGVVTLSERHGGRDVTPDVFADMVTEVDGLLDAFDGPGVAELADAPDAEFHLIGTSGTVTTLAGVHLGLNKYDRRKVDGLWLSDAEVSAMQAKLLSWDFESRAANPCIGPDRADLVLAGCAILEAIRRRWPSERMRVADRGLREGLLTDMMADDGVWRRARHRRYNNSR